LLQRLLLALADIGEAAPEGVGLGIAHDARHLALPRRQVAEPVRALGEELDRRRVADAVARGEILLRQHRAVEVGHLEVPDEVELQERKSLRCPLPKSLT
jgi:hypothetical protein